MTVTHSCQMVTLSLNTNLVQSDLPTIVNRRSSLDTGCEQRHLESKHLVERIDNVL